MTVIRPNSISGINSITANGGDVNLFRADGTAADVTVNNITSGIITGTHYGSGANLTSLPAGQLTGTVADARLSTVSSSKLSGALPALDGSALTGVGASFGNSSVNTSGIITATAFVPTAQGSLSHRNLIYNGAMMVAQRGTSSTSSGYHTVDRFKYTYSGTDNAPTQSQSDVASGTTPYTLGFRKAYKITNANQTSVGVSDRIRLEVNLEAQDIANSGWNYTSASSNITLSFWCKSSVAQNFYGNIRTPDGSSQQYSFETGSLTADTWTKITKTIPGNSNLTFDNNAELGWNMDITMFMGTDNTTSGNTMNQWYTYDSSNQMPDNTSTWYTTNGATWEITGMQLEVGDTATSFEHRSFAEEKKRCERYYQTYGFTTLMGSRSGQVGTPRILFPTEMRDTPSVTVEYGSNGNGSFRNQNDGSTLTGHTTFNYYTNGFDCRGSSGSANIIYSSTYKAAAEL